MGKMPGILVAVAAATMMFHAAPANADPAPPGCDQTVLYGLNPQIRKLCDTPVHADGSWTRFRQFWYPGQACGNVEYFEGCPNYLRRAVRVESPVDEYVVTPGTIPEGEPGHIE